MEELNCEMVRDLLPSFDEGLLHDSVRDAVSAHLDTCPSCVSSMYLPRPIFYTIRRNRA